MTLRSKNLLEAFNASAASEKAAPSLLRPGGGGKTAGPFAGEAEPEEESGEPAPRPAPRANLAMGTALTGSQLRRLGGLVVVLLIVSFFLGRASVSGVDAAEGQADGELSVAGTRPLVAPPPKVQPENRPAPGGAPESAGAVVEQDARTPAERALTDARNKYTIKLVEYADTERDRKLATATYKYLRDLGLPACLTLKGSRIFILLGAAERGVDLDELLDRALTLPGPPPLSRAAEFDDAYLERIDNVFQRNP